MRLRKSHNHIPCPFKIVLILLLSMFQYGTFFQPATAAEKIHVLFVGNSLTTAHNIPGMVADLALSAGKEMDYLVYAPGGRKLIQHAADKNLHKLIHKHKWDYVVLQEQSQLPSFKDQQVRRQVLPHARTLTRLIKNNSPRTTVVFYLTMAHQHGDQRNAGSTPGTSSYVGMQHRIARTYRLMAKENKGIVAPVGIAWQKVREDKPIIPLYADDIHPSATGAYLAACVFYATLFSDTPVGLSHPKTVGASQAQYLQEAASNTVFDTSENWRWD